MKLKLPKLKELMPAAERVRSSWTCALAGGWTQQDDDKGRLPSGSRRGVAQLIGTIDGAGYRLQAAGESETNGWRAADGHDVGWWDGGLVADLGFCHCKCMWCKWFTEV